MTTLTIYPDSDPQSGGSLESFAEMAEELSTIGVQLQRWPLRELRADASPEAVLAVYQDDIDRLNQQYGFTSVDAISMQPDHPQREEFRGKFLAEHRHEDFEIRFFVAGKGLFYLRHEDCVYALLCTAGDLISVPAGMRHWFDMGPAPDFTAIRLFTTENGWEAAFTGDDIAKRFPLLEAAA